MTTDKGSEFTWYVDEDADVSSWETAPHSGPSRGGRYRLYLVIGILLGVVLLAGAVYLHVRVKASQLRRDFQAVVDREWQLFISSPSEMQGLVTEDVPSEQVFGPWAFFMFFYGTYATPSPFPPAPQVVSVILQDAGATAWVLQEMRLPQVACRWMTFYRLTDAGWKRTAPDVRFWGPEVMGERAHIRWRTYEREAQIAQRQADEWEALYTLIMSYLPPEAVPPQVNIEYQISYHDTFVYGSPHVPTHLRVPVFYVWGITLDQRPCPPSRFFYLYNFVNWTVMSTVHSPSSLQAPSSSANALLTGVQSYLMEQAVATGDPALQPVWEKISQGAYVASSEGGPPPRVEEMRWNTPHAMYYAHLLVSFVAQKYGPQGIARLVRALRGDAVGIKAVLMDALGQDLDLDAFNREWHAYIREYEQSHPSPTMTPP